MKKNLIILSISVILLSLVYSNSDIQLEKTRTYNLDGYQFNEAPEYFKYLDYLKLREFLVSSSMIIIISIGALYIVNKKQT